MGAGGFLGSALRFGLGTLVQRLVGGSFPLGILVVNVVGCALIGGLSAFAESRGGITDGLRLFGVVGLLGGFTTYSTFANDGVAMLRDGSFAQAFASVGLHVFVGFGAVWLGYRLMHQLTGPG